MSNPLYDCVSCLALGAIVLTGCGRDSPVSPTPPPDPDTPSVAGTVVGNPDQRPVPGASVTLGGVSTSTDVQGRFSFTTQPNVSGPMPLRIAAAGHITRDSFLSVSHSMTDLMIDVITDAPPFSLDFYRQFARNAHDSPSNLFPTRRWTMAPSFYIKTTVDETGEAIPPAWIDRLRTIFINSVPELSAGRLSVAAIETGPEARPAMAGWVNVLFQRVLSDPNAGGAATVGGNQGTMWLRYYPGEVTPGGAVARPECEFLVVSAAEHEVVHTMGYFHTSDIRSHFFTANCNGANRASIVRHHAGLVYSRPPGNTDPDADPPTFSLGLTAGRPIHPLTVWCPL